MLCFQSLICSQLLGYYCFFLRFVSVACYELNQDRTIIFLLYFSLIPKAGVWCLMWVCEWALWPNGFSLFMYVFIYLCQFSFSISLSSSSFSSSVCLCVFVQSRTISSPLSLQAESHEPPVQTVPPDPAQDGSSSTTVAPHRVVEVAIPHVGTFVIQSREGGYDDEVAPVPAGACVWCLIFQRCLAAASLTACLLLWSSSVSRCALRFWHVTISQECLYVDAV